MRWPLLLGLCCTAAAQDSYERQIEEARRVLGDRALMIGQRLDAQYQRLAEIALRHPRRAETFLERGLNRCNRARFAEAEAASFLAQAKVRGTDAAILDRIRQQVADQANVWIAEAAHDFQAMEFALRQSGEWRPEHIIFANAVIKLARHEYLGAAGGRRGAIDDFKDLVRRGFLPERCADQIALCCIDVGHDFYVREEFEEAQQAWDEGLKWARQPYLQQVLWTNKAGAYETDHQYGRAEEVLRGQIERDPEDPAHRKNLGLVLGFQNHLKEALCHYDTARELCRSKDTRLALFNGSAWLRPAVIHGTLLEHEGDIRLAWRLFLEYRRLFGDDYNFSLWFGDFASAHGEYDLAWRYLEHARDLQPRCSPPYQKLAEIAPRTRGSREEVEVRTKAARQALLDAQARYFTADENTAVLKNCGGISDLGDRGPAVERPAFLEPDPLQGLDAAHPPPWVEDAARSRDPFVPFDPSAAEASPETDQAPTKRRSPWLHVAAGGAAALVVGVLILVFRRLG